MGTDIAPLTSFEIARLIYRQMEEDRPRTILAALDLQDDRILETGILLARRFRASLILLHVVDDMTIAAYSNPYGGWPLITDRMRLEGQKFLTKCIALVPIGIDARREYREGLPSAEIAAATREFGADLLLLGKHHHSLLHRVFIQSTCTTVCHHIACPVVVLSDDGPPAILHHRAAAAEASDWTPQPQ